MKTHRNAGLKGPYVVRRDSRLATTLSQRDRGRRHWASISVLMLFVLGLPASAATITVNNAASGSVAGQCTLQDAVTAANNNAAVNGCAAGSGADTIVFAPAITSITLDQPMSSPACPTGPYALAIKESLTIDGGAVANSGVPRVTIQRNAAVGTPQFGMIDASVSNCALGKSDNPPRLTLSGIALRNGDLRGSISSGVGGIAAQFVTLNDSIVAGNQANGSGGIAISPNRTGEVGLFVNYSTVTSNTGNFAAGISASSPIQILNSTVSRNVGPGVVSATNVTLVNSTISGQTGNGLEVGSLTAYFATITGNQGYGWLLNNYFFSANSPLPSLYGSVIAGNQPQIPTQSIGYDFYTTQTVTVSGDHNWIDRMNTVARNNLAAGTTIAACPNLRLGLLTTNGGGTLTHAPVVGSCLIDAGGTVNPIPVTFASAIDQRGAGFPRLSGTAYDIGSVEGPVAAACHLAGSAVTSAAVFIRYLRNITGAALMNGLYPAADVSDVAATLLITDFTANADAYDFNGDGRLDVLIDGELYARYVLGLRGSALVAGLAVGAARTTAQIESALAACK